MDFHKFSRIVMDFHRFSSIYIDLHWFSWFSMELNGSGARMSAARWHPVPPWKPFCRPTAPDWIPLILRFQILEAWIWRPGAWMPGCWKDWNGLEEVTEVTEGIGMGGGDWKKFSHARASGARRILVLLARHCQKTNWEDEDEDESNYNANSEDEDEDKFNYNSKTKTKIYGNPWKTM